MRKSIGVKFDGSANDLNLLSLVMYKYIQRNGELPWINSEFKIIRMSYYPYVPKKGKRTIKVSMEIGT